MPELHLLERIVLLMLLAVILVPLFKRIGLGSVLGYLTAGVIAGPVFSKPGEALDILHFSELGVVLLLFLIGLELNPSKLWQLRHRVFGTGLSQVVITTIALAGGIYAFGLDLQQSLILGAVLALSSTAFVMQLLAETNQTTTPQGRQGFAVLLLQDIAVIPMLAAIPLLAAGQEDTFGWVDTLKVIGTLALMYIASKFIVQHVFDWVASTHIRELFITASLVLVLGMAVLVQAAGLSQSLGAFLAGVLLAESRYRHDLEATIEPFKGLLLGLFFAAVGMSLDLSLIANQPVTIPLMVLALVGIKAIVLFVIASVVGLRGRNRWLFTALLSQGGEFAFVLLSAALAHELVYTDVMNQTIVVVTLSMITTPILLWLVNKLTAEPEEETPEFDVEALDDSQVIVAGYGRVGQVMGRILRIKKIRYTALEANFNQVAFLRRHGAKVYFGDASREELLHAAGADKVRAIVVCIGNIDASIATVKVVKKHFPHLKVYARARNRGHAHQLIDLGVEVAMRDTLLSSAALARNMLQGLGMTFGEADKVAQAFVEHDEALLEHEHAHYEDTQTIAADLDKAAAQLEALFESDEEEDLGGWS